MNINEYYQVLVTYRSTLDTKISKGKLDITKAYQLMDKLNDWYTQAKIIDKLNKPSKRKSTKEDK